MIRGINFQICHVWLMSSKFTKKISSCSAVNPYSSTATTKQNPMIKTSEMNAYGVKSKLAFVMHAIRQFVNAATNK